uniref:cytochrome P450 n=1 Tax=Paenibacillus abyssi TaxID=1340531 RepID=UPI0036724CA6
MAWRADPQGDSIQCLNPAANFDPARFADPRTFDPERRANRHFTFVGGVHICLGAHLARRELRLLLEEWFKRIPEFRVKPGADTTVFRACSRSATCRWCGT